MAPTPGAAALAAWLFIGGVMSNVVIGRMPFTLGIALAVGAWACARRSRAAAARALARERLASPVAGVFLCVAAVALLSAAGGRTPTGAPRSRSARRRSAGGLAMALLFPEGGSDHFVGTAFWPMLLVCLGALALVDPSRRTAIWAAAIYVAILVAAFAIPNSLGQNALRPGVVLGPALLDALRPPPRPARRDRRRRRRAALPAVAAARCAPSRRRAGTRRPRRPSTRRCSTSSRRAPARRAPEVPLTRNHWEATYLAQDYPLARGWHRQLDRKVNPLFYDRDQPLTVDGYEQWLRKNAVRWVALPNAPLDFSARIERGLLLADLPVPQAGAQPRRAGGSGRSAIRSRPSPARRG